MLQLLVPKDFLFDFIECQKMFELNKDNLEINDSFEYILQNSHFFALQDNEQLLGCIYFFQDKELENYCKDNYFIAKNKKMIFFNAFSARHCLQANLWTLKKVLNFYNEDIFALTSKKTAIYCLLKAKFKEIPKKNIELKNNLKEKLFSYSMFRK